MKYKTIDQLKAVLAGMCISIGCTVYLSLDNKIVGALLFSVGLLAILAYNLNLYTGKIGLVKNKHDIFICLGYLFDNVLGCMIAYILIIHTPVYAKIENNLNLIAETKCSYSTLSLFILGILCGVLMLLATKNKSNSILTIMCVSVFILCGFEHSIADAFYLLPIEGVFTYLRVILTVAAGNAVGAITTNHLIGE